MHKVGATRKPVQSISFGTNFVRQDWCVGGYVHIALGGQWWVEVVHGDGAHGAVQTSCGLAGSCWGRRGVQHGLHAMRMAASTVDCTATLGSSACVRPGRALLERQQPQHGHQMCCGVGDGAARVLRLEKDAGGARIGVCRTVVQPLRILRHKARELPCHRLDRRAERLRTPLNVPPQLQHCADVVGAGGGRRRFQQGVLCELLQKLHDCRRHPRARVDRGVLHLLLPFTCLGRVVGRSPVRTDKRVQHSHLILEHLLSWMQYEASADLVYCPARNSVPSEHHTVLHALRCSGGWRLHAGHVLQPRS
eukprot:m.920523 g.920523  ORF g.920523 m.920523 type:complete len:307 (+) comp23754_c0_seq46:2109-3029(+)